VGDPFQAARSCGKKEVDGVPAIAYSLAHESDAMTYQVLDRVEVHSIDGRKTI